MGGGRGIAEGERNLALLLFFGACLHTYVYPVLHCDGDSSSPLLMACCPRFVLFAWRVLTNSPPAKEGMESLLIRLEIAALSPVIMPNFSSSPLFANPLFSLSRRLKSREEGEKSFCAPCE